MEHANELLKKYGLVYEDLNPVERETFNTLVSSVQQEQLTIERVRDAITNMRDSLINEISNYDNGSKQDLFCKARLRNYTLILGILSSPIKAQKALDQALGNVKK